MDGGGGNTTLPTRSPRSARSSPRASKSGGLGTRCLLIVGKASRVAAVFLTFEYLTAPLFSNIGVLTTLPLPMYLFLVTLGAAMVLVMLQKPWRGKRLGKASLLDVFVAGAVLALTLYVYAAGLRACGPLRTLLLDGSELPMLYALNMLRGRDHASKRKLRGIFLALLAYSLVLYDASGRESGDEAALGRTKLGMRAEEAFEKIRDNAEARLEKAGLHLPSLQAGAHDSHASRRALLSLGDGQEGDAGAAAHQESGDARGAAKHVVLTEGVRIELGVLLILLSSAITLGSSGYRKKLAQKIGGAKKSFSLSVSMAAVALLPFALLSAYRESERFSISDVRLQGVLDIMAIGVLWIVLPYYIRAYVTSLLSPSTILRAAPLNFLLGALLATATGYGTVTGAVTAPLIVAFLLDVLGLYAVAGNASTGSASTADD